MSEKVSISSITASALTITDRLRRRPRSIGRRRFSEHACFPDVLLTPEAQASGAFFWGGPPPTARCDARAARAGAQDADARAQCTPRSARSRAAPRARKWRCLLPARVGARCNRARPARHRAHRRAKAAQRWRDRDASPTGCSCGRPGHHTSRHRGASVGWPRPCVDAGPDRHDKGRSARARLLPALHRHPHACARASRRVRGRKETSVALASADPGWRWLKARTGSPSAAVGAHDPISPLRLGSTNSVSPTNLMLDCGLPATIKQSTGAEQHEHRTEDSHRRRRRGPS